MAAEQGHPVGQNGLGLCYEEGAGVEKNLSEAFKYYKLAAEQGLSVAQDNLALCYASGKGVEKNLKAAVKFHRLAAKQAYDRGQFNLGSCFQYGRGVEKDIDDAKRWYRKAAKQGYAPAKRALTKLAKGSQTAENADTTPSTAVSELVGDGDSQPAGSVALMPDQMNQTGEIPGDAVASATDEPSPSPLPEPSDIEDVSGAGAGPKGKKVAPKPTSMKWQDDPDTFQPVSTWKDVLILVTQRALKLGLATDQLPMSHSTDGSGILNSAEVRPNLHIDVNAGAARVRYLVSVMLKSLGKTKGFLEIKTRAGELVSLPE